MKYVVTINATTKTFATYTEAMDFFKKNWQLGDVYIILKVNTSGVLFSY